MLKKILVLYVFTLIIIYACACTIAPKVPLKPPRLDANQLRSLQIKEINGDLDTCYRASLFILQDEGWIIKTADKSNGIIQAESIRTRSSFSPEFDYLKSYGYSEVPNRYYSVFEGKVYGPKKHYGTWERWKDVNVTLEPWAKNTTKIRLSFIKKGFFREKNSAEIIDDPTIYQNFFGRLKKEVFRRQNLNK